MKAVIGWLSDPNNLFFVVCEVVCFATIIWVTWMLKP